MSAAKAKMREKKMRNQPASVQYPSGVNGEGGSQNRGHGSGGHPSSKERKKPDDTGWVRGHQRYGGGYSKEMPKYITGGAFARARAAEVKAMLRAVSQTACSSHVFQALPKHMRRRAMSHNTKRLPRRLRDMADRMREKSLQAGSKKKKEPAKSKSRKARRRHGNLLLEFNRRQRKNIWLETHIWHAKRFHMVKKWGYCLGDRPTYKCYRSCYRAMSSYCLLQDLSYYCCIELKGEEDELLAALSQMTSKEAGPTFAAALCLSGRRQVSVTVYRAGQYPCQPLGPVTVLWRPKTPGIRGRQLWIWAHPTLKQDLLPELQSVCRCWEAVPPSVDPEVSCGKEKSATHPEPENVLEAKLKPGAKRKRSSVDASEPPVKKILGDGTRLPGTPVTWKSSSTRIVINDLTMEIVRYRLIGPQSHSVLTEALEAATVCKEVDKSLGSAFWWPQHCRDESNMLLHQQQADVFHTLKGISSTTELPPGTVLGLTVDDPRLTLPTKKMKVLPCVSQDQEADEDKRKELILRGVPEQCCQSSLWEESVRDDVTENKIPEQALNRMKSEMLVPGSRLSPTPPQGRVPVLLVHQPGKQVGQEMSSWGAGWDLLLPKGWGMAFWIPLVYRGVRVAGLHMGLKHSHSKAAPIFPHDFPDCPAGIRFQEEQEAEFLDKFKRHPPAKRTNYIKHGCLAPFRCPWQQLAEEWEHLTRGGGDELAEMSVAKPLSLFIVLRNRKSLRLLSGWCRPTTSTGRRLNRELLPLSQSAVTSFLSAHGMSLVWVRLSLLSKGRPELHCMVCVPTAEDLKLLGKHRDLQEPPHRDHFKSRIKPQKKSLKCDDPEPRSTPDSDLIFGLWPDPLPSVTSHCSRVTLGWTTQGDFSLCAGRGEALGFVSVPGLLNTLLKQAGEHRGTLLLRNPGSLHYRFAKVNVEV